MEVDEEEDDEEEEKVSKRKTEVATPAKVEKKNEEEDDEYQFKIKKPKTDDQPESNTIFIGNLSFSIDEDTVKQHFSSCGQITSVRWREDKETGKFLGKGWVEFSTNDAAKKALELNGSDLAARPVTVEISNPRPVQSGKSINTGVKSEKPEGCTTVILKNLSFQITDENVYELFKDAGPVKEIRWLSHADTGNFRGMGFVEFENPESVDKAMAHDKEMFLGRELYIDYAAPSAKFNGGGARGPRGGFGGRSGNRGGGRGGFGGRGRGRF